MYSNLEENFRKYIEGKGLKECDLYAACRRAKVQPRQIQLFLKGATGLHSKTIEKLAKEL